MGVVGWLIVLSLPIYAAVQLYAIVVLGRRLALREGDVAASRSPASTAWGSAAGAAPTAPDGPVRCPACGAANGRGYRFCRQCVGRIRATART